VAEDFADQTLITYPIDRARSDVFSMLLSPARQTSCTSPNPRSAIR